MYVLRLNQQYINSNSISTHFPNTNPICEDRTKKKKKNCNQMIPVIISIPISMRMAFTYIYTHTLFFYSPNPTHFGYLICLTCHITYTQKIHTWKPIEASITSLKRKAAEMEQANISCFIEFSNNSTCTNDLFKMFHNSCMLKYGERRKWRQDGLAAHILIKRKERETETETGTDKDHI